MALFKLKKKLVEGVDKLLGKDKILEMIAPLPDIEKHSRILFIGPHPDDIEIGAGATVCKIKRTNPKAQIKFLVCTDGGAGTQDATITGKEVADIRLEEAKKSAEFLGVEFERLDFEDGAPYDENDLAREIARVMYEFQPDVVFCPDPHLPTETHPDHLKCGRATNTALFIASYRIVAERNGLKFDQDKIKSSHIIAYYFTHRANTFVEFSDDDQMKQLASFKIHKSQMSESLAETQALYFALRANRMGALAGVKQAEGFFVEAPMHQHCVTESNNW